jgi:hypothetical protein
MSEGPSIRIQIPRQVVDDYIACDVCDGEEGPLARAASRIKNGRYGKSGLTDYFTCDEASSLRRDFEDRAAIYRDDASTRGLGLSYMHAGRRIARALTAAGTAL